MNWYIAITALLNLGLGYALAVYMGAGRVQMATTIGDVLEDSEHIDANSEA